MFKRALSMLLLSALGVVVTPARADDVDRARQLGEQGLSAFEQKRFDEAYEKLAEADRLHHAPTLLLYMARAKRNAGALLEAKRLYGKLVDEKLPPDASAPFREAKDSAFHELKELDERIPTVLITVAGDDASAASVTIDGEPVTGIDQPIALNPGSHDIRAAAGDRSASENVSLSEGAGVVRVELKLAAGAAVDDGAAPAAAETASDDGGSTALLGGGIAALSLGVIGVGVGIGTGVVAMNKANDVKSRCTPDNHCLSSDKEAGDSANTLATVSTAAFVIGGVALAAGIVLLVIPTGDGSASAQLRISPAGLALQGRF